MQTNDSTLPVSKGPLWTGRAISTLATLFLIFDGLMKVIREPHVLQASAQLGYPENTIAGIGYLLLACTALYAVPRTSILGSILLTGYLGGAVASQLRIGGPFLFPVAFGALIWGGLYLRDTRLRRTWIASA
jgi:hypothetical protein